MTRFVSMLPLLAAVFLAGCATSHPEDRSYSAEESQQLALEALNRQGLSFEQYNAQKARLLKPQPHVAAARNEFGDTSANVEMATAGHQG